MAEPTKRAVLFRFHKSPRVCRNRIELIRLFNPGVPVHGLYGGREERFPAVQAGLGGMLDSLYCLRGKESHWKWKNGDLALREWFADGGRELSFDVLYVIEWDLLVFRALTEVYAHVPPEGVGLTGLRPLAAVEESWSWTSDGALRKEWDELLAFARDRFDYRSEPQACIAGGACLPRAFLDRYGAADIPTLSNDELRMALFAQALGFGLYDTGLYSWGEGDEGRLFNLGERYVATADIREELRRPGGRRVFHPYPLVFGDLVAGSPLFNLWFALSRSKASKFVFKKVLGLGSDA